MGVRFPGAGNITLVTTTLVTTAETIVLTSQPLNLALDFEQVLILFMADILAGTNTTAITLRIRRGASLTGALVSTTLGGAATAGTSAMWSGCYVDSPGAIAGQQYSLTAQQTAASANGTVNDGCIVVVAL